MRHNELRWLVDMEAILAAPDVPIPASLRILEMFPNSTFIMLTLSLVTLLVVYIIAHLRLVRSGVEPSSLHVMAIGPTPTAPDFSGIIARANDILHRIEDDYATKCTDIDFQLDHPDLFRVDFAPAAAFFEQFEDTKTLASQCKASPGDASLAQRFAEAARCSDKLWGTAVAESIGAIEDGTTSLSSTEQAILGRARKGIALANDPATPDDTRELHWDRVAQLLAQLNMTLMRPDARRSIEAAIANPSQAIGTGHLKELEQ